MTSTAFLADHAFLPDGWGQNALIRVDAHGIIEAVEANAGNTAGAKQLRGATLPGLPNLSHSL